MTTQITPTTELQAINTNVVYYWRSSSQLNYRDYTVDVSTAKNILR